MKTISPLQEERLKYQPKLPECLAKGINTLEMEEGEATQSVRDQEEIKKLFEKTYGKPIVTFKSTANTKESPVKNVIRRSSSRRTQCYSRFI